MIHILNTKIEIFLYFRYIENLKYISVLGSKSVLLSTFKIVIKPSNYLLKHKYLKQYKM